VIDGNYYVVKTNLPPEGVSRVALAIFSMWIDFALGKSSLGGATRQIAYPTGRYASSIRYQQEGESTVAVIADPAIAPEAAVLETGHDEVDLKTKLKWGKPYRMHRTSLGTGPTGARLRTSFGTLRTGPGPPHFRMWAEVRRKGDTGFASIGPNSDPSSWIIPDMPAYSPALILSRMAAKMAREP
jgi:hypothetical protein